MKLPKDFEEYLLIGVIRKIKPDIQKSDFLVKSSELSFRGLKKRVKLMGIDEENTNSIIKDCYDLLMDLIRARLSLDGYTSSGNFSHEAEISYLKSLKFEENKIRFLNELRYNRNSINYYGKIFDKEYAQKVVKFTKDNYQILKKFVGKKLK